MSQVLGIDEAEQMRSLLLPLLALGTVLSPLTAQDPFTEADYDAQARRAAPRDAFPVLDNPDTVLNSEVGRRLDADEMVIGLVVGGEARAYPIAVMGKHELANDVLGGVPVAVSW